MRCSVSPAYAMCVRPKARVRLSLEVWTPLPRQLAHVLMLSSQKVFQVTSISTSVHGKPTPLCRHKMPPPLTLHSVTALALLDSTCTGTALTVHGITDLYVVPRNACMSCSRDHENPLKQLTKKCLNQLTDSREHENQLTKNCLNQLIDSRDHENQSTKKSLNQVTHMNTREKGTQEYHICLPRSA